MAMRAAQPYMAHNSWINWRCAGSDALCSRWKELNGLSLEQWTKLQKLSVRLTADCQKVNVKCRRVDHVSEALSCRFLTLPFLVQLHVLTLPAAVAFQISTLFGVYLYIVNHPNKCSGSVMNELFKAWAIADFNQHYTSGLSIINTPTLYECLSFSFLKPIPNYSDLF